MGFEPGRPFDLEAGKSVAEVMADSRSSDPIGPVFKNAAGDVIVEVMSADESHVRFLRLRKDGRRVKGRKETREMTHERFEEIYSPVS